MAKRSLAEGARVVKGGKFLKLRDAHHREKAEDYVEMIHELISKRGEARLTDLAEYFGVSSVTAHKILVRLQGEGLVASKPYRALFLTPQGQRLAVKSKHRHAIVYNLLRRLGVPEEFAQVDAEGIEHHVSPTTLNVFRRWLKSPLVTCD